MSACLSRAAELLDSLQRRYNVAAAAAASENPIPECDDIIDLTSETLPVVPDIVDEYESKSPDEQPTEMDGSLVTIEARDLYTLMQNDEKSILIIDIRKAANFAKSRMKVLKGSMVIIPSKYIRPGKRFKLEHMIVVAETFNPNDTGEAAMFSTLNDALVQFDQCVKSKPKFLLGGFVNWLQYFPFRCSSSNYAPAQSCKSLSMLASRLWGNLLLNYPKLDDVQCDCAETDQRCSSSRSKQSDDPPIL
uniref:Rhodanese domain-containing protein n=1 Tax=Trichuris muris TaxID=70415 RepID=A0A5S6QD34_TRIMR